MNYIIKQNDFENEKPFELFYVNRLGYCYNIDRQFQTRRERGGDYQLINVVSGNMYVIIDGKEYTVTKGNSVLYRPDETQYYYFKAYEDTGYFWVHFNGSGADALLEENNMAKGCFFKTDSTEKDVYTIKKMISEINRKESGYQLKLLGYFTDLIASLVRRGMPGTIYDKYEQLLPAITDIEENFSENRTIFDYSSMCNMSESSFMHLFNEALGCSCMKYKNDERMKYAENLLIHTDGSIGEIAQMCGMRDALYFSKKFKRRYGMSPREYRRQNKVIF